MMRTRKPHHFYCEIYMANIYFYYNTQEIEVSYSLKKYLGINYPEEKLRSFAGKALEIDSGTYVIFLRDKKMISTLAHECLHVANMILSSKGVLACHNNDEPQAYLLGWIVKRCVEIMKK